MRISIVLRVPVGIALIGIAAVMGISVQPAKAQDGSTDPAAYVAYTPTQCRQALSRATRFRERQTIILDTARLDPDTLGSVAPHTVAVARACLTRTTVATAAPRELEALVEIYTQIGDDSAASAAATRWIAVRTAGHPDERPPVLGDIGDLQLRAYRITRARETLRQLDAIPGTAAAMQSVRLYFGLANLEFTRLFRDSAALADVEAGLAIARRALRPSAGSPSMMQMGSLYQVESLYLLRAEIAQEQSGGDSAAVWAVQRDAIASFGQAMGDMTRIPFVFGLLGKPAPTLHADFWLGASGDSIRPIRGKTSLIVIDLDRSRVAMLQRLARRYPTLDITSVVSTKGYFQGRGMFTPDVEVKHLQSHFLDELHVPGTLAITETQFDTIPDGRRQAKPSGIQAEYGVGYTLVDSSGVVRRIYWMQAPEAERRLEHVLNEIR